MRIRIRLLFNAMFCMKVACLALLFCFGSNGFHVFAQDPEILSKRPPVVRSFDREKDESTISTFLFNPDDLPNLVGLDPSRLPPNSRLHSVEYKYPGTTQARPQAVAFVIVPLDKYKTTPNFSVTVDDTLLHEGEATVRELCCVTVNGQTQKPQQIVVTVPTEIFERMAQAKKVELKLSSKAGKYSFKLNSYQRKCLTALANTMAK